MRRICGLPVPPTHLSQEGDGMALAFEGGRPAARAAPGAAGGSAPGRGVGDGGIAAAGHAHLQSEDMDLARRARLAHGPAVGGGRGGRWPLDRGWRGALV